jgi:hypothetical protein
MNSSSEFSFQYCATGLGLNLSVMFDGNKIYHQPVLLDFQTFSYSFEDDGLDHSFEIHLLGKTPEHTVINDYGDIVSDVLLKIKDVQIDGTELEHIFTNKSTYTHDFNGTGSVTVEKFYGTMGCNGVLKLNFSTPIYLWLLENM